MNKALLLVFAALVAVGLSFLIFRNAAATEDWTGSVYGEKTVRYYFNVNKMVSKREGDGWTGPTDKVTGLKDGDLVQFRIEVTNNGDETVNDVWVNDFLPDELKQYSGDVEWKLDNFKPGETRVFTFEAKVEAKSDVSSACVVNKAVVRYENKDAASDSVEVCYGKEGEVLGAAAEALPATGLELNNAFLALTTAAGMILIGFGARKISEAK